MFYRDVFVRTSFGPEYFLKKSSNSAPEKCTNAEYGIRCICSCTSEAMHMSEEKSSSFEDGEVNCHSTLRY